MAPEFISAKVIRCIALDVRAAGVDIFDGTAEVQPMIAVCVGMACAVFDVSMRKLAQLGRLSGNSVHRRALRSCRFSKRGHLLVTCGDDNRAVVWNLKTKSAQRIFTGHRDSVYEAVFALDDRVLLTSSADGTVLFWNIRNGTKSKFFIRQNSTINTLHMCTSTRHVVSGSIDGDISVWDPRTQRVFGSFNVREGGRMGEGEEEEAISPRSALQPIHVQCVRFSPSGQYLLTACSDNMCRLWNVVSFSRTDHHVPDTAALDGVLDTDHLTTQNCLIDLAAKEFGQEEGIYSPQAGGHDSEEHQDIEGVYQGAQGNLYAAPAPVYDLDSSGLEEIPMYDPHHADLLAELTHSGPVVACAFSFDSQLAITSSQDCTCRIWDVDTYKMLFQIATPVPMSTFSITQSTHTATDTLVACCDQRLLVIDLFRSQEATEFAEEWMRNSVAQARLQKAQKPINLIEAFDVRVDYGAKQLRQPDLDPPSSTHEPTGTAAPDGGLDGLQGLPLGNLLQTERARLERDGLTIQALRRLLAHGVFKPQNLAALLLRVAQVNRTKLAQNLRRFPVQAVQLLQSVVKAQFHPTDILTAMSQDGSDRLFHAIMNGHDISPYMLRRGYQPIHPELHNSLQIMSLSRPVIDRFIHDAVDIDSIGMSSAGYDHYGKQIRTRKNEKRQQLAQHRALAAGQAFAATSSPYNPLTMGEGGSSPRPQWKGGRGHLRGGSDTAALRRARRQAGELRPMLIAPSMSSDQLSNRTQQYAYHTQSSRLIDPGLSDTTSSSFRRSQRQGRPRVVYVTPRPHGQSQASKLVIQGLSIDFATRHGAAGPGPGVVRQGRRAGQIQRGRPVPTHATSVSKGGGGAPVSAWSTGGVISQPVLYSAMGYSRILAAGPSQPFHRSYHSSN